MGTITALYHHPVKGCAAVPVTATELTSAGPLHDRTFLVVGPDGTFRSQRSTPEMAVIRPVASPDGAHLTLSAPGAPDFSLDVDLDRPRRPVVMFGTPYQGIDQGDAVAGWLTEVLGVESQLVRVPPEHHRETTGLTPGTAAFADASALLISAENSLDALNKQIVQGGGAPVPMDRFRPNLVVDGWPEPYTEDRIRVVEVGGAVLGYSRLAIRCAVTTIDQATGTRVGPEPLRTLAQHRRAATGGVAFGVRISVVRPGAVAVGDELVVTEWGETEL